MSDPIVSVDFGKDQRESARAFARLLGICEERSADILARPEFYLEQAAAEIHRLRDALRQAGDALRLPAMYYEQDADALCQPIQTIRVVKDDYDRLRRCAEIVEAAR